MSDKIKGLLERLKKADPETYKEIEGYDGIKELAEENADYETPEGEWMELEFPVIWRDYIIQGCIQRAIAARGWIFTISSAPNPTSGHCIARVDSDHGNKSVEYGDTPAAAILSAYIAAMEAQI